jgi:hypothetical protein
LWYCHGQIEQVVGALFDDEGEGGGGDDAEGAGDPRLMVSVPIHHALEHA